MTQVDMYSVMKIRVSWDTNQGGSNAGNEKVTSPDKGCKVPEG
ncbi:MAG: hypothetical protein ABI374_10490 [Ginsengibacter sp.]